MSSTDFNTPHTRNTHTSRSGRSGMTLIEMLIATTITLIIMAAVAEVFGLFGAGVSDSRSVIEMTDQMRAVAYRLRQDLAGATAPTRPPLAPEQEQGYFEYIEGPMGPPVATKIVPGGSKIATPLNGTHALDTDESGATTYPSYDFTGYDNTTNAYAADNTVGDLDDILMFTSRAQDEPFVGRFGLDGLGNPIMVESRVAEISYFVRGTTLYRRVLLVRPDANLTGITTGFYNLYDLSARQGGGPTPQNVTADTSTGHLVPNSLGDLTKRENRFGHQPYRYPHDARFWGALGLPTLQECADPQWPFPLSNLPSKAPPSGSTAGPVDNASRQYVVPGGVDPSTRRCDYY